MYKGIKTRKNITVHMNSDIPEAAWVLRMCLKACSQQLGRKLSQHMDVCCLSSTGVCTSLADKHRDQERVVEELNRGDSGRKAWGGKPRRQIEPWWDQPGDLGWILTPGSLSFTWATQIWAQKMAGVDPRNAVGSWLAGARHRVSLTPCCAKACSSLCWI